MAKKLKGGKTGRKTNVGRDVYAIIKGDKDTDLELSNITSVSEISASIPLTKNRWMNIPSIWNGMKYTDDELKELYEHGKIKATSFHKSQKEAEAAAKKRSKNLMKKSGGYLGVGKATKGYGAVRKV